jgi:hypothetical protein
MNAERIANRWVHPVWHILSQFLRRSTSGRSRAFSSCSPAAPRRKVVSASEPDVVGDAFDVLRDQDVGTRLADSDQARQIKLPAHRHAPVREIDVRDRGFAHANVDQGDDLLNFGEQRGRQGAGGEPQAGGVDRYTQGLVSDLRPR